jgi:hypothetical protein
LAACAALPQHGLVLKADGTDGVTCFEHRVDAVTVVQTLSPSTTSK